MENGPCYVNEWGNGTVLNPDSWNSNANILWIDQPVGAQGGQKGREEGWSGGQLGVDCVEDRGILRDMMRTIIAIIVIILLLFKSNTSPAVFFQESASAMGKGLTTWTERKG